MKVAIEQTLTCIPVTPVVHNILHSMQRDVIYEKLCKLGMPELEFRGVMSQRLSLCIEKASSSTKENNDPMANVARAVSSTAETDHAQDVLLEMIFHSNVARAVISIAEKKVPTKKPPSKRTNKKIAQVDVLSDSDGDEH